MLLFFEGGSVDMEWNPNIEPAKSKDCETEPTHSPAEAMLEYFGQ